MPSRAVATSPPIERRITDRAEQDGAGLTRRGEGFVGQRRQVPPKRGAADRRFAKVEPMSEMRADGAQDRGRGGDDFRTDAVTRQEEY